MPDAFLLNVGLETLHLRMARHCENAKRVAEYLKNNDKITWVKCPMLSDDEQYKIAEKKLNCCLCDIGSFTEIL